MSRARRRLAKELVNRSRKEANRNQSNHQLADVVKLKPLTIELHEQDEHLVVEDDFTLGQWVRKYDEEKEIDIDDNLVMHRVSGHWVAVDVLSDKKP